NERAAQYRQIIAGEDRRELIKLIKTLSLRQQELKAVGRRLNASDAQFLKDAEKTLYEEFALVLNIKREEVQPYITCQMEAASREDNR
ncbi:MAG: CarD family transcriptional regulator, partial [Clostridiales bacterium]|nr:CarD family transcriptional regulator [Clostridiales bacterium]